MLTYFTTDGSYLKVETTPLFESGVRQPWDSQDFFVYFPDGRRLIFRGFNDEGPEDGQLEIHDAQRKQDPFKIRRIGGCTNLLGVSCARIVDDSNREIRIDFDVPDAVGLTPTDKITATGPNTPPLIWTVNWGTVEIGVPQPGLPESRTYIWSEAPWWPTEQLYFVHSTVKYIQLTLADAVPNDETPPTWNSYEFGFSGNAEGGFGELASMRIPSGAVFEYDYHAESQFSPWGGLVA